MVKGRALATTGAHQLYLTLHQKNPRGVTVSTQNNLPKLPKGTLARINLAHSFAEYDPIREPELRPPRRPHRVGDRRHAVRGAGGGRRGAGQVHFRRAARVRENGD